MKIFLKISIIHGKNQIYYLNGILFFEFDEEPKFMMTKNNRTKIDKLYLVYYTYIYPNSLNKPILHKHFTWISPFFIKRLQNTIHIYIDGTFIHPIEYSQLLVIIFYESNTNKRYPGAYILNSKLFQAYIISINPLKNIKTKYNSVELKLKSITIDFEGGLYKAITRIFPNARIVGCFYHYMHNLTKNACKAKFQKLDLKKIIGILGKIPFVYYKDKNIIYKTFNNIYENLNKEILNKKIITNIKEFEFYFNSV